MTSVKVKFRQSTKEGAEGAIYYRILHNKVTRQITTDYKIKLEEWNDTSSRIMAADRQRELYIWSVREKVNRDLERLNRIIKKLENTQREFSANQIIEEFKAYMERYTFCTYMENAINRLRRNGKAGTAVNYRAALNSFRNFLKSQLSIYEKLRIDDIMLDSISPELMERFEYWQQSKGNIPNTISFYNRIFRAIYKRAVDDDIIEDRKPFRRVYTGVDKTEKRALPLMTIREVRRLDLSLKPNLDYARDVFLLSFYLRGMSFVDLCFLRKSDLRGGTVTYRRRKTGQLLSIAWTDEMQQILDKYPANNSDYLLPIITKRGVNERCAYRNAGYRINSNLKKIGALIGAPDYQGWSLYQARHSWASLAKAEGIPIRVISEAMGHDNERTTQIYLASLETSVVDRANEHLISLLK